MTIRPKTIVITLIIGLIVVFAGVWISVQSRQSAAPLPKVADAKTAYETREQTAGNVTVTATPLKLTPGQPPQLQVVFDTHSVNLDFDVAKNSQLADDQGGSYGEPSWNGTPAGGHHRQGTLTFAKLLGPQIKSLTLNLTNIAGVPTRVFEWEVSERR